MNKKLHSEYKKFFLALDQDKIDWAIIKDVHMLLKKGYDNEIDLVVKSRGKLAKIAKKLGWYNSTLNHVNSHVIFWKFDKNVKPLRLDFHIGKVLATAAPWIKANHILKNKVMVKGVKSASPQYELAILIIASLRGRKLKEYRVKRAKELEKYVDEASIICQKHITKKQFVNIYKRYIKGKEAKWSLKRRLGFFGIINLRFRELRIFFARVLRPAKIITIKGEKDILIINKILKKMRFAKINAKKVIIKKQKISFKYKLKLLFLSFISDVVLINKKIRNKEIFNIKDLDKFIVDKLIKKIYP